MGDMGDTYNALRKHQKEKRNSSAAYWQNKIENAGAQFLTPGVYRLGDFDIYPARGYARNYRTNERISIEEAIKETKDVNDGNNKLNDRLAKAIDIIKGLMRFCRCFAQHHTEDIRYKEAEQFLQEVEGGN